MIRSITLVLAFASLGSAQNFLIEGFQPAGESDGEYQQGLNNLDARQWDAAMANFDTVVKRNKVLADAALYWKAYALDHAGRLQESVAAIQKLEKTYPASRWIEDAKALSVEIQAAAGHPVNPASETDQDLKVLALNSQLQQNPKAALPSLISVIRGNSSDKTKEHALFVLAQSDSPDARKALMQLAQQAPNPALQISAVHMMSLAGGANVRAELAGLYTSSSNPEVKQEILNGMMLSGASASGAMAFALVRPGFKSSALKFGEEPSRAESLVNLYKTETNEDVRRAILDELQAEHLNDALLELAKDEKSPGMRAEILRRLASVK